MANTRESLGDEATLNGLINHTLTTFEEDGVTTLTTNALARQSQLTSVTFHNLTNTGTSSFQYCTGLTHITNTNFPNLSTIGTSAFANCTGLVDAVFPSVTSVGSNAFQNCTALTTFTTGVSKTTFTTPFSGCTNLQHLIVNSTTMSTLSGNLSGTKIANSQGAVYVPTDLVKTYKADNAWGAYFIYPTSSYPVSDYSGYSGDTVEDSWAEIVANTTDYATRYSVGDFKIIDLGTYGKHKFEIVGIDVDDLADEDNPGKARLTWLSKTVIATHNMNSSNVTTGGWESSAMRSWLSSTFMTLLPEVLQNNIVEVKKVSSTYGSAVVVNGQTTTDKLWIPSNHEVGFGNSYESTGAVYSKFNSNAARIKYNSSGSASVWWLRSVFSSTYFRGVRSDGSANDYGASGSSGVVLGFCI